MEILSFAFNTILYRPIFNALVLLYENLPGHDFGIAIIVLTCFIRLVLYPSTLKSIKSQKALQELQPKIKEIQSKFKKDKEGQAKAMMELYKREKISPVSGCLPMLIQLPILIALFLVLRNIAGNSNSLDSSLFYSFVPYLEKINLTFLGVMDLTVSYSFLAILAGAFQFIQTKMITPKTKSSSGKTGDFSQVMQKQMLYFFPILTILILWRLPSAIGLYWLTTTLFAIGQQYITFKPKNVDQTGTDKN
jgi:YidC/Oxa1 family membrane protein insertase